MEPDLIRRPMWESSRFEASTELRWGAGTRFSLPEVADELGISRAVLVCSERFLASEHGADVQKALGPTLAGIYRGPPGEPSVGHAHELATLASELAADAFVAIGSGSVFGLTKCAAVDVASGGTFEQFSWSADRASGELRLPKLPADTPPIVSLPTTAGSGSAVNGFGSVLDRSRALKVAMRGREVTPRIALLDAELTMSADPRLTAGAGLNAMSHCVEVVYSRQSQPISRALALEGARLIGECLPTCVRDGTDLKAREGMLLGSAVSSMAFSNAMLGLHSAFCHALSAVSDVRYTDAQSVIFGHALRYESEIIEPAARRICEVMGLSLDDSTATERLARWGTELGGPQRLRDIGVRQDELPALAEAAYHDRCVGYDPRPVPDERPLLRVYEEAW